MMNKVEKDALVKFLSMYPITVDWFENVLYPLVHVVEQNLPFKVNVSSVRATTWPSATQWHSAKCRSQKSGIWHNLLILVASN